MTRRYALLLFAFLLAACNQTPAPTPTPAATPLPPVVNQPGGAVRAAGKVIPARVAELSFAAGGQVQALPVAVGDTVAAADLLVALDTSDADADLVQAQAALFRAEANLAELQAGPRPEAVAAAEARVHAAQARLEQLLTPAGAGEIAAARANVAAAQAALAQLAAGPRQEQRIEALANLSNAEAALQQAQSAYNQVKDRNDIGMLPQSRDLQLATNNYEAAKARYDLLFAGPEADAVAAGQAQVQAAQAALERLLTPATAGQIAEAQAQVDGAQAELALLQAPPRAQTLAVAAVAVTEAEAALQRAQAARAAREIRAPFGGTITALSIAAGETAQAGQPVLTLADLDRLQVETTDLSERDVPLVAVGSPVTILVQASNEQLAGRVAAIAPQSTVVGGDVVYAVTITLDEQPPTLRWGMTVDVEIAGADTD
jgi:HlyD family secretion protein